MKRYGLIFFLGYSLLWFGVLALNQLIGVDSGVNIVAPLVVNFFVAWRFAIENGRLPESKETNSFAWQATLSTFVVGAIITAAAFAFDVFGDIRVAMQKLFSATVYIVIFTSSVLFSAAFGYLVIKLTFPRFVKLLLKHQNIGAG